MFKKLFTALCLMVSLVCGCNAASPNNTLGQLNASGVTTIGGPAYSNYLVKLGSQGTFDSRMFPSSVTSLLDIAANKTRFVDPVNGVDTNGRGAVNAPYQTVGYAINNGGNAQVYILAPGTHTAGTITNTSATQLILQGPWSTAASVSGSLTFQNGQDIVIAIRNLTVNTIRQNSTRHLNVQLLADAVLSSPITRATPTSVNSVLTVYRSAEAQITGAYSDDFTNSSVRLLTAATNVSFTTLAQFQSQPTNVAGALVELVGRLHTNVLNVTALSNRIESVIGSDFAPVYATITSVSNIAASAVQRAGDTMTGGLSNSVGVYILDYVGTNRITVSGSDNPDVNVEFTWGGADWSPVDLAPFGLYIAWDPADSRFEINSNVTELAHRYGTSPIGLYEPIDPETSPFLTVTGELIPVTVISTSGVSGDGSGLVNLQESALPSAVITNGETGVALSGSFTGDGAGITNIQAMYGVTLVYPNSLVRFVPTANTDTARGAAFTNAMAQALTSSTPRILYVGPGTYNVGTVGIYHTNLTLVGSGMDATIISGRFSLAYLTGCEFKDFSITNDIGSSDTWMCGGYATNVVNSSMKNLRIGSGGSTLHAMQLTGRGWTLDNVETYPGPSAHAFVLKGVFDAAVRNCRSFGGGYQGILLKSDTSLGMISNVLVDGFTYHKPLTGGISLHCTSNTWMQDVRIRNVVGYLTNGASSFTVGGTGTETNNNVSNIALEDSTFYSPLGGGFALSDVGGTVTVARVTFNGNPWSLASIANTIAPSSLRLYDVVAQDPTNGGHKLISARAVPYSSTAETYDFTLKSESYFSNGSLSNYINATYGTNGLMYVGMTTSYEWQASVLATNDPVWVTTGGSAAGDFRLVGWGTSTNIDIPYTGFVSGCMYVVLSSVTNQGTFKIADAYPGKVMGWIRSYSGANSRLTVSLAGATVDSLAYPGTYGFNGAFRTHTSFADLGGTHTTNYGSALRFYPRAFAYSNVVYFGCFGGGTATGGWVPQSFYPPTIDGTIRCNTPYTAVAEATVLP